jgi:hypothetical protein
LLVFQHHGQFFVAALVQVFAELALLALEFLVQIGQVTLALGAVGIGQHGGILVQLVRLGLQACGHVLQFTVALGEFGFQLGLGSLGRAASRKMRSVLTKAIFELSCAWAGAKLNRQAAITMVCRDRNDLVMNFKITLRITNQ